MNKKYGKKDKHAKLYELRLKYGYNHREMAEKLGICKAYYWQLENKKRELYYKMAKKIAHIFNLKPDDIFYN